MNGMETWVSQNPAVVLLLFTLLFGLVSILLGAMAKRELGRIDAVKKMLLEHTKDEEARFDRLEHGQVEAKMERKALATGILRIENELRSIEKRLPPDGELVAVLKEVKHQLRRLAEK